MAISLPVTVKHLFLSVIFHHFPLGEDLEYFKEDRFYPACVVMDEATVGSSENMSCENWNCGINGGKPSSTTFIHDLGILTKQYYSILQLYRVMWGRRTLSKVKVILYCM